MKKGEDMSKNELFENMYRLTKQLKGAPLKEYEKQAIVDEFNQADGPAFERAKTAIAKVLHGEPSSILEKGNFLDYVDEMIKDVKQAAEALES
jgi:hypothetical protein